MPEEPPEDVVERLTTSTTQAAVPDSSSPSPAASESSSSNTPADISNSETRKKGWGPTRRWRWYREISADRDIAFWNDRDAKENDETRLQPDESLEVPAVWVAELYTPSTVAGLLEGLHRLGWEYGRSRNDNLATWMTDVRHGRTAGWTSLGLVSPPTDRHFMSERHAELPADARAALPVLMSLTPSITALVICFILRDTAAQCLLDPLRADFSTFTTPDPRFTRLGALRYVLFGGTLNSGRTIHTPTFQRRDAASDVLDQLDARCRGWVAENFPGAFASGTRGGLFPTAMLFLTEKNLPLRDSPRLSALDGPGLDRPFDAWECDEWPGARLLLPRTFRGEELRLRFACRRSDAFEVEPGYHEPLSNWTIAQRAHDLIPAFLTRWGLSCLLEGYGQRLSALRDETARGVHHRPVRDLKTVRTFVQRDLLDIRSSVSDIKRFAKSRDNYAYNTVEPRYVRSVRGEHPRLVEEMRTGQARFSAQLEEDVAHLLASMSTSADLTQTISNIRVQRITLLLTVISVALALIAIVVATNS